MRLNRRVPNGTHGGVRGRGLLSPSYSIFSHFIETTLSKNHEIMIYLLPFMLFL